MFGQTDIITTDFLKNFNFDNVRPVIDIEKLKEWLKYFSGYIIVEIDGVEYMSDKLKHDLDTMEVTDLRIKR